MKKKERDVQYTHKKDYFEGEYFKKAYDEKLFTKMKNSIIHKENGDKNKCVDDKLKIINSKRVYNSKMIANLLTNSLKKLQKRIHKSRTD